MKIWNSFRASISFLIVAGFVCFNTSAPTLRAQTHTGGISSDGTDFFLGFMPGIAHTGSWFSNSPIASYFLICSYEDNNQVVIHYFTGAGSEIAGKTLILSAGVCQEIPIDKGSMTPSRPGEVLEYKAAHITSRYPISVQFYSEGSSSGSMYTAMPTAALSNSYVVAAWFDNPLRNNPGSINRDSSSSEFMIIAPYDHTTVTFTPNSTTFAGIVGVNTGAGSDGTSHPVTLTMRRGATYWVRSNPIDISDDLSGSTVVADKPIVVLGGQERGLDADPSIWPTLDNDIRNTMTEQMPPVVDWGTEYPSIPTMPSSNPHVLHTGDGDMYRVFTNDPNKMAMNMWQGTSPAQQYGPNSVSLYQAPAQSFENIMNPVDLVTDPNSVTSSGSLKKMYAVQYLYFQGHHDANVDTRTKKGSGPTPQSGGGDQPLDEQSYRSDEMMDLVPIDRWRLSTIFLVPNNSYYHGYQFINIITNKDSLRNITITRNNASHGSLATFIPPSETYSIPLHPELIGLTLKLPSGSYIISGNTPFACYSYGRTETLYKDIWGYAAPTAEAYGSRALPNPPKADVVPSCGEWDIRVHEAGTGGGIAEVMLLNDPNGYVVKPPEVSYNCRLVGTGSDIQDPTAPPFVVGDTSLSFIVQVNDPSKDAFAAVYAVDISGNDTIITLTYKAPALALSANKVAISDTLVMAQQCSKVTFRVTSTGMYSSVTGIDSLFDAGTNLFDISSNPSLPATLHAGDSVLFNICYTPQDTNLHKDSMRVIAGCVDTTIYFQGRGLTPIIVAGDHDFGNVTIGDTVCANIQVRNIGNAPLILDSNFHLFNNPDYTFEGPIPQTIEPGKIYPYLRFCFHPSQKGPSNSQMNWGTNINDAGIYAHHNKDTSVLLGYGRAAGLSWAWHNQQFTVECQALDTEHVWLQNTSSGSDGADLSLDDIQVIGQDAGDYKVLAYNGNPWSKPFVPIQLPKGDSMLVDIQFKPDPSTGYQNRHVQIVAIAQDQGGTGYTDTLNCVGIIRHAILSITPSTFNFGTLTLDSVVTQQFVLLNSGDTNFDFNSIGINGDQDFKIVGGPKVGDTLAPNTFDTVTVQFTAKHDGGTSNGTLNFGDNPCSFDSAAAKGASSSVLVADTGHTYPVTYICHNDLDSIYAMDVGTEPVVLDSVTIVDNTSGAQSADQFAFTVNGSRTVIMMDTLTQGQKIWFPVLYTPATGDTVSAQAIFYYTDISKGQHIPFQRIQSVSGVGYQAVNMVSVRNPVVPATGTYSAVTAQNVNTPIQITRPFDTVAQIYGVDFTIRYIGDEFIFNPNGVTPATGISNATPNAQPVTDPTDSRYNLLTLRLTSQNPIVDSGALATISWKYVVAKDSVSPFQVQNIAFLDQNQDSACWVTSLNSDGTFYGLNACGDATLRNFLKGGLPVVSIGDVIPNPVLDGANVDFFVQLDGTPITMRVFNALGQPVQTVMQDATYAKGDYRTTIDASSLPSGLYTIYLSAPGCGVSKQMLVTK